MKEYELAKIVENVIPQLLLNNNAADIDWGRLFKLNLNGCDFLYITYNTGGRGGNIGNIFRYIEDMSSSFCGLNLYSSEMEENYVEKAIATKWLEIETSLTQLEWYKILDNMEKLQRRTYENLPIVKNIIIDTKAKGTVNLSEQSEAKLIDVMAGSNYVYFVADKELRIIDYKTIMWETVTDKATYSSVPNFLQPFANEVGTDKVAISLTHSGDIIVYKQTGMVISIRKGNIVVYDDSIVKNLYKDVLNNTVYGIKCNLFDICWDLSYRRHGALIIVALDNDFEKHVVNEESILTHVTSKGIRKELVKSIQQVSLINTGKIKNRNIFLELASIDGALIIDSNNGDVKAFGAIIETAKGIKEVSGARSTAARSAVSYGNMSPIKISSDGDITLYKKVTNKKTKEELILEFRFY
ncbi:diadenylate cyclase [[Clostridium] fimetarium]|uniref:DisA checkpoint controller nucleotide-binding n=1 Tax=[Clostridium] fimetarium TaxID=99656 RepID=A0A1I0QGF9_9FIRM|nr:diadenylate cyclase [[Clostridium] fimetarium]SEW26199.1 DisA checkpoint controller nucleotide-binding [[Clostridium] fimetarium]